jgi:hypothetical protein
MLRVRRAFIFCNDSASRREGTRQQQLSTRQAAPGAKQLLLKRVSRHNGYGWCACILSILLSSFTSTELNIKLTSRTSHVVFRVHPPVASSRVPRVSDSCQESEREEHKRRGEHLHAESPSASSTSAVPPACARASAQLYCLGAVMSAPMSAVSGGCAALYKTSVEASSCREAHARSEYPTQ